MADFIPVSEPWLAGNEESYVLDCLRTGWISSEGHYVKDFEAAWASHCGMAHGIAVTSGTTALHIAMKCLPLEPGDEVILPSFTIISCASAIIEAGAKPVLVDCEPDTWTMKVGDIEGKVTNRTKAIMPVHIYGHPVDMDAVREIADRHSLYVVEDAAEVHGARYKGRVCGGMSDISAFSFYANKIITTGEGGMILTSDAAMAERARSLRNLCFRADRRFLHTEIGQACRLTNIQAAVGLAQVERIAAFVEKKRAMARYYNRRLADLQCLQLPVEKDWAENVYWMYAVVLADDFPLEAEEVSRRLRELDIETRPFFLGLHEQPVLHDMGLFIGEAYPVTERIARRGFYLPSGLAITEAQQDRVCTALERVLRAVN